MPENLREIQTIGAHTLERVVPVEACTALRELGLGSVGHSEARDGFCFVRPQPPFEVLLACEAGSGEVWVDGAWQPLGSGEVYLAPRARPHAYRALPGVPWTLCWAMFHHPLEAPEPRIGVASPEALSSAVGSLYRELRGTAEGRALRLLSEWVGLEVGRIARSIRPSRLERVWRAVDAKLDHPWTLTELCRVGEIGAETLRQLCLRENARPPLRQVTHLRMQRAAHLLRSTRSSVEWVALAVGFQNAFAFSTAFKRWSGQTPSHFRSAQRSGE